MISVPCPYAQHTNCPGEVDFEVVRDSDDGGAAHGLHSNTWLQAQPAGDSCSEGCEFADWQWEALQEKADALGSKWEPSEP